VSLIDIKVATIDDFPAVQALVHKFVFSTKHISKFADKDVLDELVIGLLNGDQSKGIILLGDGGFLAGTATPFPFGNHSVAVELGWYVEEDKRKSGLGKELLSAFEYWAKNIAGCAVVTMGGLDDSGKSFFEKNGYELSERTYIKEV
jgi:GNAT superfamily N-acetyltransferase